jgi:hypothetical protein
MLFMSFNLTSRLQTLSSCTCNYSLLRINPAIKETDFLNFSILPFEGLKKLFTYSTLSIPLALNFTPYYLAYQTLKCKTAKVYRSYYTHGTQWPHLLTQIS